MWKNILTQFLKNVNDINDINKGLRPSFPLSLGSVCASTPRTLTPFVNNHRTLNG